MKQQYAKRNQIKLIESEETVHVPRSVELNKHLAVGLNGFIEVGVIQHKHTLLSGDGGGNKGGKDAEQIQGCPHGLQKLSTNATTSEENGEDLRWINQVVYDLMPGLNQNYSLNCDIGF